jgi:hypothetical protein
MTRCPTGPIRDTCYQKKKIRVMDWDRMDVGCPCYKNKCVEFVDMICEKTKGGTVDWASKDKKL